MVGYRISGSKQWISNGGVADLYSVLANAPGGPCWFVVEQRHARGWRTASRRTSTASAPATPRRSRSTTCTSTPTGLVGGVEGQGLLQAQAVFGYTRLMVAAFGLGAGWAALDRAIPYSTERIQAGGPLAEKQGYTHKLIVPARRAAGGGARLHRGGRDAHRRRRGARSTPRARSPSTSPPRPATPRRRPPSRRSAATATRASTWSRRSSATCASPRSTRAPPRSWR